MIVKRVRYVYNGEGEAQPERTMPRSQLNKILQRLRVPPNGGRVIITPLVIQIQDKNFRPLETVRITEDPLPKRKP